MDAQGHECHGSIVYQLTNGLVGHVTLRKSYDVMTGEEMGSTILLIEIGYIQTRRCIWNYHTKMARVPACATT
jgi:hypothetical protein